MLGFPESTKPQSAFSFNVEQLLQYKADTAYKQSNTLAVELLKAIGSINLEHVLNPEMSDFDAGDTVKNISVFSLELPNNLTASKYQQLLRASTVSTMLSEFFDGISHALFVLIRPDAFGPKNMQLWLSNLAAHDSTTGVQHTDWYTEAELTAALSLKGDNLDVVFANLHFQVTTLQAQSNSTANGENGINTNSTTKSLKPKYEENDDYDDYDDDDDNDDNDEVEEDEETISLKIAQMESLVKERMKLQKEVNRLKSRERYESQFNRRCALKNERDKKQQRIAAINNIIQSLM